MNGCWTYECDVRFSVSCPSGPTGRRPFGQVRRRQSDGQVGRRTDEKAHRFRCAWFSAYPSLLVFVVALFSGIFIFAAHFFKLSFGIKFFFLRLFDVRLVFGNQAFRVFLCHIRGWIFFSPHFCRPHHLQHMRILSLSHR